MEKIAKIRLLAEYRNTAGVIIPVGEYDIADPALHGLGLELVRRREATVTARMVVPEASEPESTPFDGLTIAELKGLAKAHKVELGSARNKPDIIEKLVEAHVPPPETDDEVEDDDEADEPEASS